MMNFKLIAFATAGLFLVIAPAAHHNQLFGNENKKSELATTPKSDEEITKQIKDKLSSDKDLAKDAAKVDVKTDKGMVTLSGTVSDEDTKEDVGDVAEDVAGNKNVTNNIVVEEQKAK